MEYELKNLPVTQGRLTIGFLDEDAYDEGFFGIASFAVHFENQIIRSLSLTILPRLYVFHKPFLSCQSEKFFNVFRGNH